MSPELEDHPWFPKWMRRQQMEFLSFMALHFDLYKPLLPVLQQMQQEQPIAEWTDCCTGAGGPVLYLVKHGFVVPKIWLTDKYPIHQHSTGAITNIEIMYADVLADEIPGKGLVSFFNAFHHFNTSAQKELLQQITAAKRPMLIAEVTQPTWVNFLLVTISTTIGQLIFAPFIKPFSWKRILFTYLIPVNIITITWDGWMSVMRAIGKKQYLHLIAATAASKYILSFKQSGPWWRKVSILKGQPIA